MYNVCKLIHKKGCSFKNSLSKEVYQIINKLPASEYMFWSLLWPELYTIPSQK